MRPLFGPPLSDDWQHIWPILQWMPDNEQSRWLNHEIEWATKVEQAESNAKAWKRGTYSRLVGVAGSTGGVTVNVCFSNGSHEFVDEIECTRFAGALFKAVNPERLMTRLDWAATSNEFALVQRRPARVRSF